MNKNTIIALVLGLIVGGLAVWLFMFFAQGSSLGTAIGLSKTGGTTIDWSKYMTVQDANHISVKNGASARQIDQSTTEIITPDAFQKTAVCACGISGGRFCQEGCTASIVGGMISCSGSCDQGAPGECEGKVCSLWDQRSGLPLEPAGSGGSPK